tara:strand:- start:135 stop:1016 length:882 start_codon:yes stop_codon:yes gene_type:complete
MSELFGGASDNVGIESLAQAQENYNTYGSNTADQNAQEAIQNALSNVGDRSNIRNSINYDPIYAQAFNMSRGLQPGNRVEGTYPTSSQFYNPNYIAGGNATDLARPSYLQPQVRGEKGMYFSDAEKFLQETLPPIISGVRKISPTGIIQTLIEEGLGAYNKGKDVYDETFKDTIFQRYNYDNEQQNKVPVGIMENMDRAESTDLQRALMAGYDNARMNPVQIDPNTQTALNLKDVKNFLTRPDVVSKGLGYAEPYIQSIMPEGVNFDSGLIYNQEKPEDSYTGFKFTIPFSTG